MGKSYLHPQNSLSDFKESESKTKYCHIWEFNQFYEQISHYATYYYLLYNLNEVWVLCPTGTSIHILDPATFQRRAFVSPWAASDKKQLPQPRMEHRSSRDQASCISPNGARWRCHWTLTPYAHKGGWEGLSNPITLNTFNLSHQGPFVTLLMIINGLLFSPLKRHFCIHYANEQSGCWLRWWLKSTGVSGGCPALQKRWSLTIQGCAPLMRTIYCPQTEAWTSWHTLLNYPC